jgi:hypothetical protein
MNMSHELNELATALSLAQADIAGAHRNSDNPFFKSKYSDLASCWSAVREPLTKNGLSIVQHPSATGSTVSLETVLLHKSGQWMSSVMTATAKDSSPQALISIVTYLRRAGLCAIASVAPVDDDAESAQSHAPAVVVPPDFYAWLDDLIAVADNGDAALKAAWAASSVALRSHIATHHESTWTALKARAKAAGK